MKALCVLTLVCILFLFSGAATPAALKISAGLFPGEYNDSGWTGDFTGFSLKGEVSEGDLKFSGEYILGEAPDLEDFSIAELKAGFGILRNREASVYLTAGYLQKNLDLGLVTEKTTGLTLGADAVFLLNRNVSLEGSIGFSLAADIENYSARDVDFTVCKLKLNSQTSRNMAVNVGYSVYRFSYGGSGGWDERISGVTLGITSIF